MSTTQESVIATVRHGATLVLLIEPAKLVRDSLSLLLHDRAPDLSLEAVPAVANVEAEKSPAVVVVCTRMLAIDDPEVESAVKHLEAVLPDVPRLMVSERLDPGASLAAIRQGWQGFFPVILEADMLIAAIRLVSVGGMFLPPAVIKEWVARPSRSNHTDSHDS